MIVWIVLGVLSLVVLVGAYLASKRWHWAHVLVLVAFYAASVGYFVLAARTLDSMTEQQEREAKALADLEVQQRSLDAVRTGTDDGQTISRLAAGDLLMAQEADQISGIVEQRHELRMKNRERGRVWRNATPSTEVDPQTGAVTIGVPVPPAPVNEEGEPAAPAAPGPLGLATDSVVYLFHQGAPGGGPETAENGYLGEFRVVEPVSDREVRIAPLGQLELDPYAAQRLIDSQGPWIIYESMPSDRRDLFADFDEEQLRAVLPEASVEEFVRDGGPTTPDDPPLTREGLDADGLPVPPEQADEAVSYRYRRLRRDYGYLFKEFSKDRAALVAAIQAAEADIAKLAAALEGAERLREFRLDESRKLQADLASLRTDREAIDQHLQTLEAQIERAERLLVETLRSNAELAELAGASSGVLSPVATGALDIDAL